jgi:regulator of protease activity HflC (stomatin/prohibitin superfamily)
LKKQGENSGVAFARPQLIPGIGFLIIGLILLVAPLQLPRLDPFLHRYAFELAAAFLVGASGFLSSFFTQMAQARGPLPHRRFERSDAKPLPRPLETLRQKADRVYNGFINIDWLGDWLSPVLLVLLSAIALYAVIRGWRFAAPAPSARLDQWTAGVLVGLSFPLLVIERYFVVLPPRFALAPLVRLLRLILLNFLGLALCCVLRLIALSSAPLLENAVFVITGAVATELILRAAAYVFLPLPPLATRQGHATSALAGMIKLQRPSFRALNATITRQFGIDLGRSWAIAFIRRATIPILIGMAVFSWLLTGVTALGTGQRAVYEAFGQTRAVLQPGLNFHLPWPLGVLRAVDYGEVREIPIVFAAEDGTPPDFSEMNLVPASIEGPPPPNADRLWDSSHPSEASYLVADFANGQQSFEVVNIDVRIVYRIGMSDSAARDAVYNVASPESLIRAVSGQMLARHFARYTIDDVLGQNREAFIRGFQRELQQRLTALSSGLEVIAVVVEAIHPPPAAADAYQGVQAAAIQSAATVFTAQAAATGVVSQAQIAAITTRNAATATSAERVALAKSDAVLFNGDYKAYAAGGAAFLFERRLSRLSQGLAGRPLIIVDHHIPESQAPIIDNRATGAPLLSGNTAASASATAAPSTAPVASAPDPVLDIPDDQK